MEPFADNKEFRAVLYDKVRATLTPEQVDLVLDNYADAVAIWLKFTEQPAGGYLFGRNNEFTFRVADVPEHEGHGEASGRIEATHFAIHVKPSAHFLRVLGEKLGKEVKPM